MFGTLDDVEQGIDDDFKSSLLKTLILGLSGTMVTFGFVFAVANYSTRPFVWMERLAWAIVNHSDTRATGLIKHAREMEPNNSRNWLPTTEVTELVLEFRTMINNFSGTGASHIADEDLYEIKNEITWQSDFQQVYIKHSGGNRGLSFLSNFLDDDTRVSLLKKSIFLDDECNTTGKCKDETPISSNLNSSNTSGNIITSNDSPQPQQYGIRQHSVSFAQSKFHCVSNININTNKQGRWEVLFNAKVEPMKSRLFWCIFLLIVVPLCVTNLIVGISVSESLIETNLVWLDKIEQESLDLEVVTLESIVWAKANEISVNLQPLIRDLHLMTRMAGWLYFNAINRSDAFTRTVEGSQECRNYHPDNRSCPIFETDRGVCLCKWEDESRSDCTSRRNNTDIKRRYLQHRHVFGQMRDADEKNGYRNQSVSFGSPGMDDSPSHTLWWSNFSEMPGMEKGRDASGFATTYDRVRVSSAMSVVDIPLYNYISNHMYSDYFVGAMIAFHGK